MAKQCIVLAFNGKWTPDYKYIDHETRMFLHSETDTFEDFRRNLWKKIDLDEEHCEAFIWFDMELGTSKGVPIKNTDDLISCLHLMKNNSEYRNRRFIVDITQRSPQSERVDYTEGQMIMQIDNDDAFEVIVLTPPSVEAVAVDQQLMHAENTEQQLVNIELPETSSAGKKRKRYSRKKIRESPRPILKENADLDDIKVGSIFLNKQCVTKCFQTTAIAHHFEFKVVRSSTTRYSLACMNEKCEWTVRSSRIKQSTLFKILKFEKNHTCSVDDRKRDQKHATSKIVRDEIVENLRDDNYPVKPNFVVAEIRRKMGVVISYNKAWRAIKEGESLIRGTPEENFQKLPAYLYVLKDINPGSHVALQRDDENRFKYMFFACAASIKGWKHCRPVMVVDGTFLKGRYSGTLLVAVTKDANNQIFPLAFGVVDSENNLAYNWFFRQLRIAFGCRENLLFLSDRNPAIANGIANVYPECAHGICVYHLEKNLNKRNVSPAVISIFNSACRVYTIREFKTDMNQMKETDRATYDYLMEEPPERWTSACCRNRRYDMMTSNIVESMNNALLHARGKSILSMVDNIMNKLQTWFYERRKSAQDIFFATSKWTDDELKKKIKKAYRMNVDRTADQSFKVTDEGREFIVCLKKKECQCLKFQMDEMPCEHALAAIDRVHLNKSDYCSIWYKRETWLKQYEAEINTVGHEESWVVPDSIKVEITKPPDFKVKAGRRQEKRFVSTAEYVRQTGKHCGICRKRGHNRTSCRHTPVLHPYSKKHNSQ